MLPPSADGGSAYAVYERHSSDGPDGQPRRDPAGERVEARM